MERNNRNNFRKAQRIKRRGEIADLLKKGEKWRESFVSIYSLENKINRNRCAVIVPRESGTAVQRNKIRRNVKELFRKTINKKVLHHDVLVKIRPVGEAKALYKRLKEAIYLWVDRGIK